MIFYLLFSYYQNCLFHHPRFFALFLFWKRKTALKEKQARGRENPPFPRTNRSIAPTTTTERQYERARALLPCCGARNSLLAIRSQNFDRGHSLASLPLPPAAVGSLPLPDPPVRGTSREDQALPSRASPAIINRSLAGYRSRVHSGK